MKKVLSVFTSMVMLFTVTSALAFPSQAANMGTNSTVAAIPNSFFAIKSDGSLWSWSYDLQGNMGGELGDGSKKPREKPKKILDNVVSVSAYDYSHAMAIKSDGTLWAWGNNSSGQILGSGKSEQLTPVKIMDGVKDVSLCMHETLVLKNDNTLWIFGGIGLFSTGATDRFRFDKNKPAKIMDNVKSMAHAGQQILAVKTDGSLWAWGWKPGYDFNDVFRDLQNKYGNDYDSINKEFDNYYYARPTKVMDNVNSVESAGFENFLIIKNDKSLWAWGIEGYGMHDSPKKRTKPAKIMDNVVQVSGCSKNYMAVKSDGTLWGIGRFKAPQEKDDRDREHLKPVQITQNVTEVATGSSSIVFKKTDGSVWTLLATSGTYWGGKPHLTTKDPRTVTFEKIWDGSKASAKTPDASSEKSN